MQSNTKFSATLATNVDSFVFDIPAHLNLFFVS